MVILKNKSFCLLLIILASVEIILFAREGKSCLVLAWKDEIEQSEYARVVERYLNKGLGTGQAIYWYLDGLNSFVVKVQGCLMIFDYTNDNPVKKDGNFLERSLLTGVVEPEEIKNQNVVVFFSHKPSTEIFPKVLKWKEKIIRIHYVVPHEVWDSYKSIIEEKEAAHLVKIAKANQTLAVGGLLVKVYDSIYKGVEYRVDVNGLTIYHPGIFPYRHIATRDNKGFTDTKGAITKNTKKVIFKDGKAVLIDEGRVGGDLPLAFAIYSNPQLAEHAMDVYYVEPRSEAEIIRNSQEKASKFSLEEQPLFCDDIKGNVDILIELSNLERQLRNEHKPRAKFFGYGTKCPEDCPGCKNVMIGGFRGQCILFNPYGDMFGSKVLFAGYLPNGQPLGKFRE